MSKGKGWVVIRVRRRTRDRLRARCRALTAAVQAGQTTHELSDQPCSGGAQGGITLDVCITDALDRIDAHAERARRQQERAKQAKRAASKAGPSRSSTEDLDGDRDATAEELEGLAEHAAHVFEHDVAAARKAVADGA